MDDFYPYSNFNAGHSHNASGIGDGQYKDGTFEELFVNTRNTGNTTAAEAGPVTVPGFTAFTNGVPDTNVATPFDVAEYQVAAPTPVALNALTALAALAAWPFRPPSLSSVAAFNIYLRTHPLGRPMSPHPFGTYGASTNVNGHGGPVFLSDPHTSPPSESQRVTLSGPGESFAHEAAAYPPASVPTTVALSLPPPMASLLDDANGLGLGGPYDAPQNTGGHDVPVLPDGFNTFAPSDIQPFPMPAPNISFANEIVPPQPAFPSVVAPSLPSTLVGYPFPLGGSMIPQPFGAYGGPPNTSGHNALFNADALYNLPPPNFHPGAAQEQGALFPLQAAKAHADRFQSAPRHTHHHFSVNARHAPYNTEMPQANAPSVGLSANHSASTSTAHMGGAHASDTGGAEQSLLQAQLAEHRRAIRSDPINWEVADDVPEDILVCEYRRCTATRRPLWNGRYRQWKLSELQRYITHVDTHRPKGQKLITYTCAACRTTFTRKDALHRHESETCPGPMNLNPDEGDEEGGAGAGSGNAQAGPSRLTAS
ncbi:unnamed protein product [Peniophora sp. CBMAI 1063]|nr:unnamed protein product [Peniophora sp. CBMAI 1063]